MGHLCKILLLLCVSRLTLGDLSRFVRLTPVDPNEDSIEVSGVIKSIDNINKSVNGEIRIRTRYPVKLVYCDPYSDIAVGNIVRETKERATEIRRFIVTMPANVAVLNTILGSAGLRCTAYVNDIIRHFMLTYGTDGGVKLLRNATNTELKILRTVYKDAPHLLWLLIVVIAVAVFILVTIPVALIISNRRSAF